MRFRILDRLNVHMREVVLGASITLSVRGLAGLLGFAVNVVLARILGAEGAGVYFLALALTTIAATLSRLGLDNATLRFVAGGAALAGWGQVKSVHRKSLAVGLSCAVLVATVLFAGGSWIAGDLFSKPELVTPLRVMALAIPFVVLMILQAQALRGIKRIFFAQLTHGMALPLFALIGILLLARTYGIPGAAAAYVVAAFVAATLGWLLWRVATPELSHATGSFSTHTLFQSSVPLFFVAALNLTMEWTSTLLLGAWSTSAEVGIYSVAQRTAFIVALVLTSVNSIAAPKFSELYAIGDRGTLGVTARNATRLMILMAAPVLLLLIVFPGFIMGIFGQQFVRGWGVLAVLAIGQFINVSTGSVGFLLIMCGEERVYRNNTAFAAIVNVALNVLLIPRWHALGAAVATATALATLHLTAAFLVWRRLRIQPFPLTLWE